MLAPSIVPPSRFFPAPRVPFDTEIAVASAGNLVHHDAHDDAIRYVASDEEPGAPRQALVRASLSTDAGAAAARLLESLRPRSSAPPFARRRVIVVEDAGTADRLARHLVEAGLSRTSLTFWSIDVESLANGERLDLEPLVGDEAWRAWTSVEREILAEAIAPAPLTEAQLDRSVQFKRKQQRDTPPIRRFVGRRAGSREPIAMIGYAPFSSCTLGGHAGVLARLRDVAVRHAHRRRGVGVLLLRAIAARAFEECGAEHLLICGASEGPGASLYGRVGARAIGGCVMFAGDLA